MSVDVILGKIDRVRRRWRAVQIAVGVLKCVLTALALLAGFFLLDWLALSKFGGDAGSGRWPRAVLLLAMIGVFAWVAWREVLRELRRRREDEEIAARVEKAHPELRGRLVSTLQLSRDKRAMGSRELIAALEADTVRFAAPLAFTDIVNLQMLKKAALIAAAFTLLAFALGAWRSDFAKALFARLFLAEKQYPTAARFLSVTPGAGVAHGEPFTVRIELDAAGYVPEAASVTIRGVTAGKPRELVLTKAAASADARAVVFTGTIEHVLEDLEFRPTAYDARWQRWERLRVLQRPMVSALALTCHFPEYLGKADERSTIGDIRAPVGATVRIEARLNKPVSSARVRVLEGVKKLDPVDMTIDAAGTVTTIDLPVRENGSYAILLHCRDDLDNVNPVEYAIEAIKDRSPTVKITAPAQDKTVTRFAHWKIAFTGKDDYGIKGGSLKYRVDPLPKESEEGNEAPASTAPVRSLDLKGLVQGKAQKDLGGEVVFDLRPLNIPVDQRITYWIEVQDTHQPEANIGQSQSYVFNVVDAAVLQAMLDKTRKEELERLQALKEKQVENRDGVDTIRRTMSPPLPGTK
jgi:hypothetical protein